MNNDLISRSTLKEDLFLKFGNQLPNGLLEEIDKAPTVELTESEVQEVLNKRCMTAVANEYLIALHGKTERPQGEWGNWVISEIRCPNCLEYFDTDCYSTAELRKCPNCGAKMKGGAE